MSDSVAKIAGIVLMAGVGLGTLIYYLFGDPHSEHESHQRYNRPPPPTSSTSSPRRLSLDPSPSTSSSSSRNRSQHRRGQTDRCFICKRAMSNTTTRLNCGHIFDEQCYNIWQELTGIGNPNAGHCPRCKSTVS